jgi:hypothetical protein
MNAEYLLDKVLSPSIVWVFIPVLAILFWGLTSVIHALRGTSEETVDLKTEVRQLRTRMDELERAKQGSEHAPKI